LGSAETDAGSVARISKDDIVLCADGGARHAVKFGIAPTAVIGDMDSGGTSACLDAPKIVLPKRKDVTDTHACIDYGAELGCDDFLLLGCLGGPRFDHMLANLCLLEYCAVKGHTATLLDGGNEIVFLRDANQAMPNASKYNYFSILPIDQEITSVFLEGLEYRLENAVLRRDFPMAVSNAPRGRDSIVRVSISGAALILLCERRA
jgi:thiamine pyrophosphokinase